MKIHLNKEGLRLKMEIDLYTSVSLIEFIRDAILGKMDENGERKAGIH